MRENGRLFIFFIYFCLVWLFRFGRFVSLFRVLAHALYSHCDWTKTWQAGKWMEIGCLCFVKEMNPYCGRSFSDEPRASFAGLNTFSQIMENSFLWREPNKNLSSLERIGFHSVATVWFSFHLLFWRLRKNVSTWLTVLPVPCFQVLLEFFSPSSTLKLDSNGWFIL